jgi:hypothetical protein
VFYSQGREEYKYEQQARIAQAYNDLMLKASQGNPVIGALHFAANDVVGTIDNAQSSFESFGDKQYAAGFGYAALAFISFDGYSGGGAVNKIVGQIGTAAKEVKIGLGLAEDLVSHRGTGAITWKNAGWQEAGLTKVDFGKMLAGDEYAIKEAFRDASEKSTEIRFDISGFDPFHAKPGITNYEFDYIINNPGLLQKTTFIQDGAEVTWNGTKFLRK